MDLSMPAQRVADEALSYEEKLSDATKELGPLVAIGNPNDKVYPSGAARFYLKNDDWQKEIEDTIKKAQIVFFHIGDSEALIFELKTTLKLIVPEQLIICLPLYLSIEERQDQWTHWKEVVAPLVPSKLPLDIRNALFIYFDSQWNAHVFPGEKLPFFYKNNATATIQQTNQLKVLISLSASFKLWKRSKRKSPFVEGVKVLLIFLLFVLHILFTYFRNSKVVAYIIDLSL